MFILNYQNKLFVLTETKRERTGTVKGFARAANEVTETAGKGYTNPTTEKTQCLRPYLLSR